MSWQTALTLDSYRSNSQDRAAVVALPDGIVCMIADGVGGRSGGGAAAEFFVQSATSWANSLKQLPNSREQYRFLRDLDVAMTRAAGLGETTALLAAITDTEIIGVATGDSVCWWITESSCVDLTANVGQKPWLGSGMARISTFEASLADGTILMATDGLSKYADQGALSQIVRQSPFGYCGQNLIAAVRPLSGRLPDDVAIIVARSE